MEQASVPKPVRSKITGKYILPPGCVRSRTGTLWISKPEYALQVSEILRLEKEDEKQRLEELREEEARVARSKVRTACGTSFYTGGSYVGNGTASVDVGNCQTSSGDDDDEGVLFHREHDDGSAEECSSGDGSNKEERDNDDLSKTPMCASTVKYDTADEENLLFELSCVMCEKDSGTSIISCTEGHGICDECFNEELSTCPASIAGLKEDGNPYACGAGFFGLGGVIKNASYYKGLMKNTNYECAASELGCKEILSVEQVRNHEDTECPYRVIRFCGFQSVGCTATFSSLQSHLQHLVKVHSIPVAHKAKGMFMVRYDRKEYRDGMKSHNNIVPLIRGVVKGNKGGTCLILGKDVGDATRIWIAGFGNISGDKYELEAQICVCPTLEEMENEENPTLNELACNVKLPVLRAVDSMVSYLEDDEDEPLYIDLPNTYLDQICVEEDGDKYFTLLILIKKIKFDDEDDETSDIDNRQSSSEIRSGVSSTNTEADSEEEEEEYDDDLTLTEDEMVRAEGEGILSGKLNSCYEDNQEAYFALHDKLRRKFTQTREAAFRPMYRDGSTDPVSSETTSTSTSNDENDREVFNYNFLKTVPKM